jgi:hypothetical protein
MEKIIKEIGDFLRRHLGKITLLLIILLIIWKWGWWISLMLGKLIAAAPWLLWVIIIIILIILIICGFLWIMDLWKGGTLTGTGPCRLMVFRLKKDKCVNVSCATLCAPTLGPYPKWMGWLAPSTQDVSCTCVPMAPSKVQTIVDILDKIKDQVLDIDLLQQLKNVVTGLLGSGEINDECVDRIWQKIWKKQTGEAFTDEEIEEIKKILEECKGG